VAVENFAGQKELLLNRDSPEIHSIEDLLYNVSLHTCAVGLYGALQVNSRRKVVCRCVLSSLYEVSPQLLLNSKVCEAMHGQGIAGCRCLPYKQSVALAQHRRIA
jgi:hypothetical protein